VLVETFADPEQFCGTVSTANHWQKLGETNGFGRQPDAFPPNRLFGAV
jgi:hypothetical protein